jgi:hypothetical protein
MSRKRGTFVISRDPSARSDAAMIGRTAFFAPDTRTVPDSGFPPLM